VSRYTKVPPGGCLSILTDGYQLCARCGSVLCADDRAEFVCRAPWWTIYTHLRGLDCPAKAVSGWRAVELARDMSAKNAPTPREADAIVIGGFSFPFVSLLDDEHCEVEMGAVTISQHDFLPTAFLTESENGNPPPDLIESWSDSRQWREWRHREATIVEVLDQGVFGALVNVARHVLKSERERLYVKGSAIRCTVTLSEKDERPIYAVASSPTQAGVPTAQVKSRGSEARSRGVRGAFPHDALGKAGEYPLYSRQQLTDGRRVLTFGRGPLDEFTYYWQSGPRLTAPNLPFNSASSPDMFDWCQDVPKAPVGHWKRNPKSVPYGPVARLKPAILASLRISISPQFHI
jgi:hypothetical protein